MELGNTGGNFHFEVDRKGGFVAFTVRGRGFTAVEKNKREWWQWANPIEPAFSLFGWVVRLIHPSPTPKYWQRLSAWFRTWNGLTSIPTYEEAQRGFYVARPRPEWLKQRKQR